MKYKLLRMALAPDRQHPADVNGDEWPIRAANEWAGHRHLLRYATGFNVLYGPTSGVVRETRFVDRVDEPSLLIVSSGRLGRRLQAFSVDDVTIVDSERRLIVISPFATPRWESTRFGSRLGSLRRRWRRWRRSRMLHLL